MGWRGRSDDEYRDEIAEHIELETQANLDRGMTPDDARRAARAAFGSVASVRQRLHEGRSGHWLSAFVQDIRYGWRTIRRNRLLSIVVALTMSLGIGSTTAVFSIVSAMAFAPPVSRDPGSFVLFTSGDAFGYQVATVERYETLRRDSRSMRDLAAWSEVPVVAPLGSSGGQDARALLGSCNLFDVLSDLPPVAGRFPNTADCDALAPVAVMSRDLWRTRFSSDPGIVGKSLSYGGRAITIVGVAASVSQPDGQTADLWLPYTLRGQLKDLTEDGEAMEVAGFPWLGMAGRLADGYSRRAASAEFSVLTGREKPPDPDLAFELQLTDGSLWSMAPGDTLWMFSMALAFPTLMMLIIGATVATLLLSRAVRRQREMAIRLAIGGGRLGLIRMLLLENLLLAGLAAVVGLAFVYALPPVILRLWFSISSAGPVQTIQPDWKVIAYMGIVTIISALCAGLAPAFESLNLHLTESLKGRLVLSGRRGIPFTQGLLVGIQVAFSMVLVVAAAAVVRAERRFANPGFESRHVVHAQIPRQLPTAHTPSSLAALVEQLPGVRSVAYAESLPAVFESAVFLEDLGQPRQPVLSASVSPGYFDALGIRIVAGREFVDGDAGRTGAGAPVVVSRQFARRFFPGQHPLGKTMQELGPGGRPIPLEIVGVVENRTVGFGPLRAPDDGSFVYRLMKPAVTGYLLVRFDGDARQVTPALQGLLKQTAGWVVPVSTIQSSLDQRMSRIRGFQGLVTTMGAIGVTLAVIGVFGILAFTAVQRRKEVAIRTALGARRLDIFGSMVLPALRPTGIGIVAGALLSFPALRLAESLRTVPLGAPSVDPATYLAGGVLLLCAALLAMSPPAYRATVSDPARALRED
jgi:predicted permease